MRPQTKKTVIQNCEGKAVDMASFSTRRNKTEKGEIGVCVCFVFGCAGVSFVFAQDLIVRSIRRFVA